MSVDFGLDVGLFESPGVGGAFGEIGGIDYGIAPIGEGQVPGVAIDIGLESGDAVQFEAEFAEGLVEELELQEPGFGGTRGYGDAQIGEANLPDIVSLVEGDTAVVIAGFCESIGKAEPNGFG
ncbi:MAG: hypothetical protein NTV52_32515 [Acidobacteria bacterium]|nr:hypothetical protein [Acidobacteriota bacterium]